MKRDEPKCCIRRVPRQWVKLTACAERLRKRNHDSQCNCLNGKQNCALVVALLWYRSLDDFPRFNSSANDQASCCVFGLSPSRTLSGSAHASLAPRRSLLSYSRPEFPSREPPHAPVADTLPARSLLLLCPQTIHAATMLPPLPFPSSWRRPCSWLRSDDLHTSIHEVQYLYYVGLSGTCRLFHFDATLSGSGTSRFPLLWSLRTRAKSCLGFHVLRWNKMK